MRIGSEELEELSEFKYLGSMVSADGDVEAKLKNGHWEESNYGRVGYVMKKLE